MVTVIIVLSIIAQVIFWMVLIQFLIAILASFDIINMRQPFVAQVYHAIDQLLSPLLEPIRRVMPNTGAIDFSPMVLLVLLQIVIRVLEVNFL